MAAGRPLDDADYLFMAAKARLLDGGTIRDGGPPSMPYLASAIMAIIPVRSPGFRTMGVDKYWRLYWDPEKVMEWGLLHTSAVLAHEVFHLLREHNERWEQIGDPGCLHRMHNYATDATINDDLRDAGWALPGTPWFPENVPGGKKNMTSEQLYGLLRDASTQQPPPDKSDSGDGDPSPDSSSGDGNDPSDSDEQDPADSGTSDGDQDGSGDSDEQDSKGGSGGEPDDGDGSDGDGDGDSNSDSDSDSDAAGNGSGASDPHNNNNSSGGSASGNCPYHGKNCPGSDPHPGDCGSGAGGDVRPWEIPPGEGTPTVSPDQGRLIGERVAVSIREHQRGRGNVPGGLVRWAEDMLDPQVDWRKVILKLASRVLTLAAGRDDYTYSRRNRRQTGKIILPGMVAVAPPTAACVVDTSGSMADQMLSQILSELERLLSVLGGGRTTTPLSVISCDAEAGEVQKVRKARQTDLTGGGGTDMRVGIQAVVDMHPVPDLAIIATDGYTPWPDVNPNPKITWVVLLVREHGTVSSRSPRRTPGPNDPLNGIPSWMKVVECEAPPT